MQNNFLKYPNLELLEYQTREILQKCPEYLGKLKRFRNHSAEFEAFVFPQTWGSTALGFDKDENDEQSFGGQEITKSYTVVMHETKTDCFVVFFGNKPCYMIFDPSPEFFEDLRKRRLKPYSQSERY